MRATSDRMNVEISEALANLGIELKVVDGPRAKFPLVRVTIPATSCTKEEALASVVSLLSSSCQDYTVDIVDAPETVKQAMKDWLKDDLRFRWIAVRRNSLPSERFALVLLPGSCLGVWSLEALIEAQVSTGASVIRALVNGIRGASELWESSVLGKFFAQGDPERFARELGTERWISGSSLGMHGYRHPAPSMHLRKGAAGRHELVLVIRDATVPAVRADYEERIRILERRLANTQTEVRKLEAGQKSNMGIYRIRAIVSRGPRYALRKIALKLGRDRLW